MSKNHVNNIEKDYVRENKSTFVLLLYASSVLVAILLPLLIWQLKLPIVQSTYGRSLPFELFSFFISIVLTAFTWHQIKEKNKRNLVTLVPVILPLLVSLNLLFTIIENSHVRSSDYICYENAAKAIIDGLDPYTRQPTCYLYPPLLAQILSLLYQGVTQNPFSLVSEEKSWQIVFYFYQCGQFLQVILAYYLTYLFCREIGLKAIPASLIVATLFLANNPLIRTLNFNQMNLWILNSFMLSIVLLRSHPFLSGLSVALGAHLKLYTLVLLLPWSYTKRWRAILGVAVGFLAILIIQINLENNWTLWQQFISYLGNLEKPTNYRNNGIWSLVYNSAKIPIKFFGTDATLGFVPIIVAILNFLLFTWFIIRAIKREKVYVKLGKIVDYVGKSAWSDTFRLYGHSMDAIAFSLLISPSVWEHHYVLAIPIAVWAIATRRLDRPWLALIGVFLIFCIPTFEIFPLSFHRLVGLLILVFLTAPESVQNYFMLQNRRKGLLQAETLKN